MNFSSFSLRLRIFFGFLALVSLGRTYLVTQPVDENEIWYFGQRRMIRWTSVITDPAEITIAIVNNNVGTYPTALSRIIKVGLPKEQGQYVIGSWAFDGLKEGEGYQINLLTKEAGSILAQSPLFTLSSWDVTDTDIPSNSGEEKGNKKKNGESHQKHPSNPDNDEGPTVRIHYNKTTADQILDRTPRYDGKRTRCSVSRRLGHGVVRIVRRAY